MGAGLQPCDGCEELLDRDELAALGSGRYCPSCAGRGASPSAEIVDDVPRGRTRQQREELPPLPAGSRRFTGLAASRSVGLDGPTLDRTPTHRPSAETKPTSTPGRRSFLGSYQDADRFRPSPPPETDPSARPAQALEVEPPPSAPPSAPSFLDERRESSVPDPRPVGRASPPVVPPPAPPRPDPSPLPPEAAAPPPGLPEVHAPARWRQAEADLWPRYTELRRRVDEGERDLTVLREAAETASRLSLHLEAVEHYKLCLEITPDDQRLQQRLQNLQLSAGLIAQGPDPAQRRAQRIPREARPFWTDLGSVLTYPLRGRGLPVLLVGGVMFGIADLLSTVNVFGWLVSAALMGYVTAYLFDVVNATANGRDDPPALPESTSVLESMLFPFLSLVVCSLLAFLPFVLVVAATTSFLPGWFGWPLAALALPLGVFVFPMTLLIRAMFQTIGEVANPRTLFGSIGRVLPDYVAVFASVCFLWIGLSLFQGVLFLLFTVLMGGPPTADALIDMQVGRLFGWAVVTIVGWPAFLYVWMIQGHLLGCLYRQGLRRLAWFVPSTDETRRATRISTTIVCLGLGAALTLSGVTYLGATKLVPLLGSGALATVGTPCPLRPGTELTYYWRDSEGGAGLVTYAFEAGVSGQLDVHARSTDARWIDVAPSATIVNSFVTSTGVTTDAGALDLGGVRRAQPVGVHTWFFGPSDVDPGESHVNGWKVIGTERHLDTWDVARVHHPASTEVLLYDQRTGVLVGREFRGMGVRRDEWLVGAKGLPGLSDGPPAAHTFPNHR